MNPVPEKMSIHSELSTPSVNTKSEHPRPPCPCPWPCICVYVYWTPPTLETKRHVYNCNLHSPYSKCGIWIDWNPRCDEASCVLLQQSSSREIFFCWMIHIHHQPSLLNLIIGHNMGTKIKSTKPVQNRFEDEKATLPKNVHTLKVFYNRSKYLNKQSTWFWVSVVGIKMQKCFLVFSFILLPNSVGWL